MSPQPDITLYFLSASRAIRIAWLLEELNLDYKLIASPRLPNNLAPPEFKAQIPSPLGKSPTLKDGDLVVQESAAITEYLCETYDTSHRLLPQDVKSRAKVREFLAAAEATFMIHALAVLYARLVIPDQAKSDGTLDKLERGLSKNVHNDLNWLEKELEKTGGRYLVGSTLTAADIMVAFSIEFIFARELGLRAQPETEGKWQGIRTWLEGMQKEEGYRKAVQRTGYKL